MKKLILIFAMVLMMTPLTANAQALTGNVLTRDLGVNYFNGEKETWYDLNMDGVVQIMRDMGFDDDCYPYLIRDDGIKMFGPYIMLAAPLNRIPRGTVMETSLGLGIVCDNCESGAIDIAADWYRRNGR